MLVAIGACYLDTILTTQYYPGEDEKLRATNVTRRRGGNCPNMLEVLQQLTFHESTVEELPLALITILPAKSSIASQKIKSAFGTRVNLDHCIYREEFEEPASCYIIKSQSTGSRTIVNYNSLTEMTLEEFTGVANELGPKARWFHFEGRTPEITLQFIHYLRKNYPSLKVSVEIEKPGRQGLQELAEEADVVFYSKIWAKDLGYRTAERCLREQSTRVHKASLLCCTWGEAGASALEPNTGKFVNVAAYTTENFQVIDPIGAGDTFIAGMLYALNCKGKDWDLSKKLAFANRVAGMKVSQEGFAGLDRALASFV
ncbi:pfkB family kinase [Penicillium brasilianum]|uniref:PfkB family kinase n=1 Tax=Penicillium brasilianum TaxID=104259 RepID=A0A1S9S1P1_PENBI|nr:pfkB family kinase [Penicillium brasilianum]